jgi:hypothetical protein
MKNHFFQGMLNSLNKHAEEGYEGDDSDTVFGEKPVDPTQCEGQMPAKKKPAKAKGKKPLPQAEQLPSAPGPLDAQK